MTLIGKDYLFPLRRTNDFVRARPWESGVDSRVRDKRRLDMDLQLVGRFLLLCPNINQGWRGLEEHANLFHSSPCPTAASNKQEKRERIALIRQAILSFALRGSSEKTLRRRRTAQRWRRESIKIILSSPMMLLLLLYFFPCLFSFVNERIEYIHTERARERRNGKSKR